MAFSGFVRKVWADRVSEFPLRRRLTDTTSGVSQQVTVARDEGTVTTQGDTFDAANMNGLEARIASSFTEDEAAIGDLTQLATTNKNDLVVAINEVKASVPTFVPESLGDLDNVDLSTSGIAPGSVLSFNASNSTWINKELPASDVTFSAGQIVQSTNVQNAIDFVAGEMDAMQTNKVDVDDFYYQLGESISIAGMLCPFWQAGNSVRVLVPLSRPIDSAVAASVIRQTGNFEIRMYNGTAIASGHPLSDYGTLNAYKVPGGIAFVLSNLNSTWGDTTRYTTGFAYANSGNTIKLGGS